MTTLARLTKRRKTLSRKIAVARARLRRYQNARLCAGGSFFLSLVALALWPQFQLEAPVLFVFFCLFTWLVIVTRKIDDFSGQLERFRHFTERQENRVRGGCPSGRDSKQVTELAENLKLPRDLGLFGPQSFWTLLDETLTDQGLKRLLSRMVENPLPAADIRRRQDVVQSLRSETWFYTRLTLKTSGRQELRLASSQVSEFLKTPFTDSKFKFVYIFTLFTWITAVGLVSLSAAYGWAVLVFALVNLGNVYRIGDAFLKGTGLAHHLGELAPIFRALEHRLKTRELLRPHFPQTINDGPARQVRRLERILMCLGTQTNPLLHLILNAFLPWTMTAAYFLERRRARIATTFPICMQELSEFEVIGSLLIFDAFQTKTYPELSVNHPPEFKGLFHPLLERTKVVANDFSFPPGRSLGLLTGSNMSGKSTFLRTVGLNQILANMGAPVFAHSMRTMPLKIETCIEVSDSLRDGVSYFYAEVRRLKAILDDVRSPRSVLYLIDEIFRGTNNRERQIGSRAVIQSLASSTSSFGFVSTHDLELVSLETTSPRCLNLHFREDIDSAGKMVFSYHLRPGPCPTTNALKIMQAEGIDLSGAETS